MTEAKRKALYDAGVDVAEGLRRAMGRESLYEALLDQFILDSNFMSIAVAIEAGNLTVAAKKTEKFRQTAAPKGMVRLAAACDALLEACETSASLDAVQQRFGEVQSIYRRIMQAIRMA